MTLTFDKARWSQESDGFWLHLKVAESRLAQKFIAAMKDRLYIADLKEKRERRSLDANAYCWVLLDKLAASLNTTKEELYRLYVKRVGVFRDFHLDPEEAKSFEVAWSMLGTGWLTEQVDYTQDGERVVIRAYYGSSRYNTKQMSRLIDEIVEACKDQGIETKTPDELAIMKETWNAHTNEAHGNPQEGQGDRRRAG